MRLFTLCSYLLTKECYDWWIIRRKWGFKQQISEEKNLKVSVTNIWKHSGGFRKHARWLRNFASWRSPFRSQRLILQLQNWPSAWCDWLSMAITSSFQFRFTHHLKRWISDFPSFETTYSMNEMDSKKYSKCVQQFLSSWILYVRFLSLFRLLAFMICFWQRNTKLQSLDSSCKWASICFVMDSIELSSILDCFGDQNTIKNTKT